MVSSIYPKRSKSLKHPMAKDGLHLPWKWNWQRIFLRFVMDWVRWLMQWCLNRKFNLSFRVNFSGSKKKAKISNADGSESRAKRGRGLSDDGAMRL